MNPCPLSITDGRMPGSRTRDWEEIAAFFDGITLVERDWCGRRCGGLVPRRGTRRSPEMRRLAGVGELRWQP